jgi:hypothetical protein
LPINKIIANIPLINNAATWHAIKSGGTLLLTQAYVNKKIKARAIFANSSGALEYVYSEPSKLITNVNDIAIIPR